MRSSFNLLMSSLVERESIFKSENKCDLSQVGFFIIPEYNLKFFVQQVYEAIKEYRTTGEKKAQEVVRARIRYLAIYLIAQEMNDENMTRIFNHLEMCCDEKLFRGAMSVYGYMRHQLKKTSSMEASLKNFIDMYCVKDIKDKHYKISDHSMNN